MSDPDVRADEAQSFPNARPAVVLACRGAAGADLNLVRCLGRQGVPVIVVGEYDNPPSGYSRHCTEFICARDYTQRPERLLKVLRELRVLHGQALPVFTTSGPDLQVMTRLHADLVGTALWLLASPDMVARLRDPRRFADLAREAGLPVPETHAPETLAEVERLGHTLAYPVVLKPAIDARSAQARVQVIHDADSLMQACCQQARAPHGLAVVIQAFVPGDDDAHFSVHAWIDRAGRVRTVATTREWRTSPVQVGAGCLVESVSEPVLEAEASAALARLRLRGVVVMHYKRDARDGRFMLLEIHPRASSHCLLLARAGLNLPWLAYRDACGRPAPAPSAWRVGVRYLSALADYRAFRTQHRQGRLGWGGYLRSILRPGMTYRAFDLDDLGPAVEMTLDWVRERLRLFLRPLRAAGG